MKYFVMNHACMMNVYKTVNMSSAIHITGFPRVLEIGKSTYFLLFYFKHRKSTWILRFWGQVIEKCLNFDCWLKNSVKMSRQKIASNYCQFLVCKKKLRSLKSPWKVLEFHVVAQFRCLKKKIEVLEKCLNFICPKAWEPW